MTFRERREALHEQLCTVLGSRNCYFQAPTGLKMRYPCIRYDLESKEGEYADNIPYLKQHQWGLTVIDYDPESNIPDQLEDTLPYCSFDRSYCADGLNHFVLTLYF